MNGIHDMGGMHGLGSVPVEEGDALHAEWERITFAMHVLAQVNGFYNLDEFRHARERIEPVAYLESSYYENWLRGMTTLLREKDVVSERELADRLASFDGEVPVREDEELAHRARRSFEADRFEAIEQQEPAFETGDRVVVKNHHPRGHTRIPGYARRATGVVRKHYGSFYLPDSSARGERKPEPCYSVGFPADELWGERTDADAVFIDMFESYIDRA